LGCNLYAPAVVLLETHQERALRVAATQAGAVIGNQKKREDGNFLFLASSEFFLPVTPEEPEGL
jgi:hypothetical protein